MDHSTQQLIDKFKRNHAALNAAAGNTKELATMLSNLMKSPEGMAIMNRINDSAKK